jgi:hypothetical protein
MDVFNADQSRYLGSVIKVWHGGEGAPPPEARGATGRQTGSAESEARSAPELTHEQGATVHPTERMGSKKLGEEMGPVPTIAAGNTGPVEQSAERHYATDPEHSGSDVTFFAVRPGRINPLARPLYIPTARVRSISMERIIVDME